jgi:hypothetical protein
VPRKSIDKFVSFIILYMIFVALLTLSMSENIWADELRAEVVDNSNDEVKLINANIQVSIQGKINRIAYFTCDYKFENLGNNDTDRNFIFPGEINQEGIISDVNLENFTVFVNYLKISTKEGKEKVNLGTNVWGKPIVGYRNFFKWVMNFPSKKTTLVRITYSKALYSNQYIWSFNYEYPLISNWKVPLENTEIVLHYKNQSDLNARVLYLSPKKGTVEGKKIYWVFSKDMPRQHIRLLEKDASKNSIIKSHIIENILKSRKYEGNIRTYLSEDLEINKFQRQTSFQKILDEINSREHFLTEIESMLIGSTFNKSREEIIRIRNEIKANYIYTQNKFIEEMHEFYIKVLRNEIYARHGRLFKSSVMKQIFEDTDWYKPNPNYSDDMLNDIERTNIQFILEYEKKKGWR